MMKPTVGTFLSIGSPVIVELASLSGFDWVLIDLEHGSGLESAMPDQLRATNTLVVAKPAMIRPER